jgi:hypothetical protein
MISTPHNVPSLTEASVVVLIPHSKRPKSNLNDPFQMIIY